MKYMLDTNIVAYAINRRPEAVFLRFREHQPDDMCVSSITMAELEYGIAHSSKPERNRLALMMFLSNIKVISFDAVAAREYGLIRHDLAAKGTPIGSNDMLIAAHARAEGLILVTNNVKEFDRVPDLKIENWAE